MGGVPIQLPSGLWSSCGTQRPTLAGCNRAGGRLTPEQCAQFQSLCLRPRGPEPASLVTKLHAGVGRVAALCVPWKGASGFLVMAGGVKDPEVSLGARPGPRVPLLNLHWASPAWALVMSTNSTHTAGLWAVMP